MGLSAEACWEQSQTECAWIHHRFIAKASRHVYKRFWQFYNTHINNKYTPLRAYKNVHLWDGCGLPVLSLTRGSEHRNKHTKAFSAVSAHTHRHAAFFFHFLSGGRVHPQFSPCSAFPLVPPPSHWQATAVLVSCLQDGMWQHAAPKSVTDPH